MKRENLIYHYCTLETLISIVQNKTIRLSDLDKTNDYLEKTWAKRFLYDALCDELENNGIKMNLKEDYWYSEEAHNHFEQLQEEINRILKHQTLIACFSEKRDSLGQWRAYAVDGTGVAIGFNYTLLKKVLKKERNICIDKVIYEEKKQKTSIRNNIYNPAFKYVEGMFSCDKVRISDDFNPYFVEEFDVFCEVLDQSESFFCFMKNPAFQEEAEVRIVYNTRIYDDIVMKELQERMQHPIEIGSGNKKLILNPMNLQLKSGKLVAYADLDFSQYMDEMIKEIVIGPKAKIDQEDIRQLLCVNGFDDIVVCKTSASYR